jgi:hypothetical protein
MGLAERRATLEFQNTVLPGLKKQIDDAAGFDVPLEIDWESLAEPNEARLYNEYWSKIYFEPLIQALQSLCADDLGKQAVKDSLKKVQITNSRTKFDRSAFSFENGVLMVDHKLTNADDLRLRTETIVSRLEEAL